MLKLNGDIAKIWKHTCTFSSPIAWFQATAPFPDWEICSPNLFPSTNLLSLYTCSKSLSSMPPFRRSSHAPPSLFLFSLYSYQPLKLNLLKRIHFPFFYFPSFFQKSECSSLLMQDLLFPYVCSHINSFFLIKYFSYLFERTCLSESWIAAHILLSNNRKTKIERIKTKRVSNLATYQILK